jgi:hypothetical protein
MTSCNEDIVIFGNTFFLLACVANDECITLRDKWGPGARAANTWITYRSVSGPQYSSSAIYVAGEMGIKTLISLRRML